MKIKFLTLNAWHGGIVFDNLIKFVKNEKPDIAFFQEVYDGHDESMDRRFRAFNEYKKEFDFMPYAAFEPSLFDSSRGNIGWGNAVFSRFPVLSSKALFFEYPLTNFSLGKGHDPFFVPRNMQCVEIDLSGKVLYGFNLHGVWDRHGDDSPRRYKMLEVLKNAIKDKTPAILAGDTNLSPKTEFVKEVEKSLSSVFENNLSSTFNMEYKTNPGYATAVVDMIFVSPDINVVEKQMPDVSVSDHMPLTAVIEIYNRLRTNTLLQTDSKPHILSIDGKKIRQA